MSYFFELDFLNETWEGIDTEIPVNISPFAVYLTDTSILFLEVAGKSWCFLNFIFFYLSEFG